MQVYLGARLLARPDSTMKDGIQSEIVCLRGGDRSACNSRLRSVLIESAQKSLYLILFVNYAII